LLGLFHALSDDSANLAQKECAAVVVGRAKALPRVAVKGSLPIECSRPQVGNLSTIFL
jgi:hypothetical protein